MNESAALDVAAMRVIETADGDHDVWSDADRAWASHAAAAAIGEGADTELFIARRARLVLERLQPRYPGLRQAIGALAWRPWVGVLIVLGAFFLGLLADRVGDAQRINVLAPPVLLLLFWNLAVYVLIALARLLPAWRAVSTDPLRGVIARIGSGARGSRAHLAAPVGPWVSSLALDWAGLAAPLYQSRAARVLHLAAAALAAGVVAGLYLRGLAFEYRATWESTFLDPAMVHALLSFVLAPGAWLGGLSVPDLAQVSAIRAPGSQNAGPWLHLIALTLLALVVIPRMGLAAFAWMLERRRAGNLALSTDQVYFRRLLRGFHVEPTQVMVMPYGYTPAQSSVVGLELILSRLLGGAALIRLGTPIGYGEEDDPSLRKLPAQSGPVVVLFNLAATPEREAHAAFAATLKEECAKAQPLLVVVDETSFRARAGDDGQRMAQRRTAWKDMLGTVHVTPAFVDLSAPDLPAADAALDIALNRPSS